MTPSKSRKLHPIEDKFELATFCRIVREERTVGCYILGANHKKIDPSKLIIKFGFTCQGTHPTQLEEQFENINQTLGSGFKEINSTFTFRHSCFCGFAQARAQLQNRLQNPVSPECQYLDSAQLARKQELAKAKKRKQVMLTVETTFKPIFDKEQKKDLLDRVIENADTFWQRKILNKAKQLDQQQLTEILNQAYNAAMRHLQILEGMGLKPVVQSEEELWEALKGRIGAESVNLPHLLVLDDTGLHEEFKAGQSFKKYTKTISPVIGHEIHAASRLLQNGVPFADRRFVCIPSKSGKKQYVGALVLEDKPEGFWGDKGQILYLWSMLGKNYIFDFEVITEITPADVGLIRLAQQLLTRNSVSRDLQAQERGTVEVSAQVNLESSVEAQRQLYTGDVPFHTSVVILVYRNSPQELDEACRLISGLVKPPAKLGRELEYAWLIWLQTLGVRREALLSSPYYRRLQFFASELSGVSNLVQVAEADKQGFELIADEGNSPVLIDLSKPKNVLVLGTTGSGKSVLVASIIAECLALGMSFLIIDLPNADGSGTFGDFTNYFAGIYFDISRESNNLMQPLNLNCVTSEEDRKERIQAHRNDVIVIISQLVLGSNSLDGFLFQTIESLIPLGIKAFYQNPSIQARFVAAAQEGLGSKAWDNTPTLADLIEFFSTKHINLGYDDSNVEQALNHIRLRLQFWLASQVGYAIGKPSTFDIDSNKSQLITFALTNLQSEKEAEIFALSAYLAARRQSLSSPKSALFMDEASVLLRFISLSVLIGRLCATARKAGSRVILAGQDVNSIAKSAAGEQILQNVSCRLIGRILPGAAQSYEDYLGISKEIVSQNENFQPNISETYTQWLLHYNNTFTHCRYYPSYPILALTANSREEQAMRDTFKAKYPNKFDWLTQFYRFYKQTAKQGKPL